MNVQETGNSLWLRLTGVYAVVLSGAVLFGTIVTREGAERYYGGAIHMPVIAVLIALALTAAGVGLFLRSNLARILFLVVAPWGSIALASAFPRVLWPHDIPYTAPAIFVFVPLAFLLSRGSTLRAVGAKNRNWFSRGGALVLACAAVVFLVRTAVVGSRPSMQGNYSEFLRGIDEHVKQVVICKIALWNYLIALAAVSIPTGFWARRSARMALRRTGDSLRTGPTEELHRQMEGPDHRGAGAP